MIEQLNKNDIKKSEPKDLLKYWDDILIFDYFNNYYETLSQKKLDTNFKNDLKILTNVLKKLSQNERKTFVKLFADILEFYINQKIEKDIDTSFKKILKI